ncbi:MAG: hypothetical protein Kow0090_15890 [Myxococcota bacterium]
MLFLVALSIGVKKLFFGQIFDKLPIGTIEVAPRSMDVGIFRFKRPALLGGNELNEETIEHLRNIEGVVSVFPLMAINAPLQARGEFFGNSVVTDLAAVGISAEVVKGDIPPGKKFTCDETSALPALVSETLLELYNNVLSSQLNLPKINPKSPPPLAFDLIIGASYLQGSLEKEKIERRRVEIVGVSKFAMPLGVTIPLECAVEINRRYHPGEEPVYNSAIVKAEPKRLNQVTGRIEEMGLAVDGEKRLWAEIIIAGMALLTLFAVMFVIFIAVMIYHIQFMQVHYRKREIGILRALGATKSEIRWIFIGEPLLINLFSGLFGIIISFLLAAAGDRILLKYFSQISFEQKSFFSFPFWLIALTAIIAVLFAILGSFYPAGRAAKIDPARALLDR